MITSPLLSDIQLVQNIKNNFEVEESIKGLLDYHEKLINKISYKYVVPLTNSGSSIEEIEKEKYYIVYKAALSFNDKRKTKFSSYLGSFVRWYCLNRINRHEDWKFVSDTPFENLPELEAKNKTGEKINFEYIENLLDLFDDKKIKKLFELRFFSGDRLLSWNKIGKVMGGVSGQTVNNWYRKNIKVLQSRAASEYNK